MAHKEIVTDNALAQAILALAEKLGTSQEQQAETLEALRASQPPRDVSFGDTDYQARLKAETKVFPRPVFQNGREANPAGESDATLAKIAELKPGKYIGGFVTIDETPKGGINFVYKNATPDQRMVQMGKFTSFADLVAKCHAEMQTTVAA
jgi:hypothetical protein